MADWAVEVIDQLLRSLITCKYFSDVRLIENVAILLAKLLGTIFIMEHQVSRQTISHCGTETGLYFCLWLSYDYTRNIIFQWNQFSFTVNSRNKCKLIDIFSCGLKDFETYFVVLDIKRDFFMMAEHVCVCDINFCMPLSVMAWSTVNCLIEPVNWWR